MFDGGWQRPMLWLRGIASQPAIKAQSINQSINQSIKSDST
jgi:hypothetical protein